jgi:hypothetical protein
LRVEVKQTPDRGECFTFVVVASALDEVAARNDSTERKAFYLGELVIMSASGWLERLVRSLDFTVD